MASLESSILQKFISYQPRKNPTAKPMDILPVNGIPRFDKTVV